MPPSSSLPGWLAEAIRSLHDGNIDGWMKIYAPEAVHEFPFAAANAVQRLEGRDAIAAYMSRLPEFIRFGSLSEVRVREADDELIVEATGHHHRVADNAARDLSYVWFITLRDGKVVHFRDYMNPLQLSTL